MSADDRRAYSPRSGQATEIAFKLEHPFLRRRTRVIRTLLTDDQRKEFAATGFCVLPPMIEPELVQELRADADRLLRDIVNLDRSDAINDVFGGLYIRDAHRRSRAACTLVMKDELVGTVRSLIGPRVRLRYSNIRVSNADDPRGTAWHVDLHLGLAPVPPLYAPHGLTTLTYLDSVGHLLVVPGSHLPGRVEKLPEELDRVAVAVQPAEGETVFIHAGLLHRAAPIGGGLSTRRVVIFNFVPLIYGPPQQSQDSPGAFYSDLLSDAHRLQDEETIELLDG